MSEPNSHELDRTRSLTSRGQSCKSIKWSISRKPFKIETRFVLSTYINMYMPFQMATRPLIFDDLEGQNSRSFSQISYNSSFLAQNNYTLIAILHILLWTSLARSKWLSWPWPLMTLTHKLWYIIQIMQSKHIYCVQWINLYEMEIPTYL